MLNRLKDTAIAAVTAGRALTAALLLSALRGIDLALLAVAMVSVGLLVWQELRSRAFSRLLATMSEREAQYYLLIVVAWCGHAYLNPGVLLGGDTATHISRFMEIRRGLQQGTLAQWTNYQYGGAPLLWFTGPLTYVIGGVLAFIVGNAMLAGKLLLFSLHIANGWLFFVFMRRLQVRPLPALLASIGYACAFARLHLFLYRGVLPQAITSVCLVVVFMAADGLLRNVGRRWVNATLFALATAGLILNHQPHALFAAFYLAVFGAVALSTGLWRRDGLKVLLIAGAIGVCAAAAAVVPTVIESSWVMLQPEGAMLAVRLPTLQRLANLLLWRDTRTTWGTDYWAYLGLGLIAGAGAGLLGWARGWLHADRGRFALPAAVCLLTSLLVWNSSVRDIQYMLLFLGILAALGVDALLDRPLLRGRRLLAVVVIVLADLASTSVQPVARTDKAFLENAGRMLERTDPGQRVVEMQVTRAGALQVDLGPDAGPISYDATVQRIAGNHNMAATRLHNPLLVAAEMAQADLQRSGVLSPATQAILSLLNVGPIICENPEAMGCPAFVREVLDNPVLGRYLLLPDATPAIFSRDLVTVQMDSGLEKPMFWPDDFGKAEALPRIDGIEHAWSDLLAREDLDLPRRTARAIAVRDTVRSAPAFGGGDPGFSVMAYRVGLTAVQMTVRVAAPGYVQLAHPWFPSTVVTVNGKRTIPLRGTIGLLVVPVAAGVSTIVLRDGWTADRLASLLVSICGFGGIVVLARQIRARPGALPLDPAKGEALRTRS